MPELILRRQGPIGRLVFSNPTRFNAMTAEMWAGVPGALAALDADPAIRVIVLEGDADRAFVSGADISQFESQRTDPAAQARYNAAVEAAYQAPIDCSKPVIASIRGVCMGGGLGLAAACDLRFCRDDARFRMPAGRLGLGYGIAGVERFLTVIGLQNTLDIFFSARVFDAADALRMGFVSRVSNAADHEAQVDEWCRQVADNAPLTLRALKRTAIARAGHAHDEQEMQAVHAAIAACFASDDYREGALAFMEKRAPRFSGS